MSENGMPSFSHVWWRSSRLGCDSLRGQRKPPADDTTRCADKEGRLPTMRLAAQTKKAACSQKSVKKDFALQKIIPNFDADQTKTLNSLVDCKGRTYR